MGTHLRVHTLTDALVRAGRVCKCACKAAHVNTLPLHHTHTKCICASMRINKDHGAEKLCFK